MSIDREQFDGEFEGELRQDKQYRRAWRRRHVQWRDDVPSGERNAGLFWRRVRNQIHDSLDAGESSPDVVLDQLCGSGIVAQIIISAALNFLFKLLINRIMKKRGLLPQDCEVEE